MKFARSLLPWSIPLAILAATLGLETRAAPGDKPNVITILVDDLDAGTFETALQYGLLPNLKRYVLDPAVRFKESFVTNAVCCPSRATFLTGQYSHNHQVFSNAQPNGAVYQLDDSSTLPIWLQTAGYRTAHFGKYLNGYGMASLIKDPVQRRAFLAEAARTDPYGAVRMDPAYVPPGWSEWFGLADLSTYCMYNYTINENGAVRTYMKSGQVLDDGVQVEPPAGDGRLHHYQTDHLADRAIEFIERSTGIPGQPFFMAVMPLAPHVEVCDGTDALGPKGTLTKYTDMFAWTVRPAPRHQQHVPALTALASQLLPGKVSFNEESTLDKPKELRDKMPLPMTELQKKQVYSQYGHRLAALLSVDDLVGRIGAKLEEKGELGRTAILFTSDNGWLNGEHRMTGKVLAYEESARVPLYARIPGVAAQECGKLVLNNDLAPTIAKLAGATPTHEVDGRSLLETIFAAGARQQGLVEHYLSMWDSDPIRFVEVNNLFAIRTSPQNAVRNRTYVEYFKGLQMKDGYYLSEGQTIPSGTHVSEQLPVAAELYHVDADPLQTTNLLSGISTFPTEVRQALQAERAFLRSRLMELVSCKGNSLTDPRSCRLAEDRR
ncbi:MAG TPA: sulfatase [Bdellovibrionota bacterium]|nr:sulfatase [Bdellovibrionota bacterium]